MCYNFCGNMSIFGHVCAGLQSLEQGMVCQRNCFFTKFFPKGSESIRTFKLSSSYVAHRDEKLEGEHSCAPSLSPRLIVTAKDSSKCDRDPQTCIRTYRAYKTTQSSKYLAGAAQCGTKSGIDLFFTLRKNVYNHQKVSKRRVILTNRFLGAVLTESQFAVLIAVLRVL